MFTLEELYGVDRNTYCERTGTSLEEMVVRLQKEITTLEVNLAVRRVEFIQSGSITDEDQRYRAKLIKKIEDKIKRKMEKVKDIRQSIKEQL